MYLALYIGHTRTWYKLNIEMLNNIIIYKLSVTMDTNNIKYVYLLTIIIYVCTYKCLHF